MSIDAYCLLGHPVAHSLSPWIHRRFAQLTQQKLRYDKRDVAPGAFAAALQDCISQGLCGCNVTVPFKFEAAGLAQQLSSRVVLAQSCNCLRFEAGQILADNTDGLGLVYDIEQLAGRPIKGRRLLLLGAGGASAGVLGPLLQAQPAYLSVANRTLARARQLVARHLSLARQQQVALQAVSLAEPGSAFDMVINATSCSLQNAGVPVAGAVLAPQALAYDMMYGAAAEPFLQWASCHRAQGRDGLGMLVAQAAQAFLLWRGLLPPVATVLAELQAQLEAAT